RSERAYPARLAACHVVGHVGEYGGAEAESLRTWGRVVARPRSRLAAFRRSAERDDARAAVERVLGREIGSLESAAELSLLLREPGVGEKLSAALGPAWEEFGRWIERPDVVELAEGESVWMRARGHLRDRRVGRIGVERAYNELLRGRHGYSLMIRNLAFEDGRPVPELDYLRAERPAPGADLVLEIDMALRRVVESALAATGRPGAAVFIDTRSGAVKALASRPAFDPNAFTSGDAGAIRSLLSDPAAAALEEGVIRDDSLFECAHEHRVAGRTLRCMADPGHGEVAVTRALTVSCNIFYYQAAERLGARALLGWARDFGFDAPTGIDLPGESSGTLPRADGPAGMRPTTLALLGIGQGPIAVTPLQVARGFAAIAADGPAMRPHVARLEPRVASVFALSPHVREAVVRGLKGVVHDEDGTAYRAFHEPPLPGERSFAGEFPGIEVAGKTGTAERSGRKPNAWFAGFAPVEKPEIAFAVVVEGGGHGGDTAAPAAARMLGAYFRLISLPEGDAAEAREAAGAGCKIHASSERESERPGSHPVPRALPAPLLRSVSSVAGP
ncbi:MAG: peptidoglycan D,D-transpeptidase FtsI family protein, partial [Planctomycetota bacterium]